MPIDVLTGLPGSGKSTHLVRSVSQHRADGKPTWLFLCSDAFQIKKQDPISLHKRVSTRAGESCDVDYFVSTKEALEIIESLESDPPAFFAFEEAQYFGDALVEPLRRLSAAGHQVLISTPTPRQISALGTEGVNVITLKTTCNLLSDGEATKFYVLPETQVTLSVCDSCSEALVSQARQQIYKMLVKNEPHPGEKRVYQPVDIGYPEFSELEPIRGDSAVRADIMKKHISEVMGSFAPRSKTYIDVGCNTGYFCRKISELGFASRGVDVVGPDITLGNLLDTYFYRRHIDFICDDAVKFLINDPLRYDVTSSFSVFQWLFLQSDRDLVFQALQSFFEKANALVFFEIGYVEEGHYKGRLQESIDRDWTMQQMKDSGCFSDVILYEQGTQNLKRDFFVGIRK